MEANFLLKPIFLHGFSVLVHLVLLLILLISCFFMKFKINKQNEGPKQIEKKIRPLYFKKTLPRCLGMSIFNLVLCLWEIFYWYSNSWSDEKIVYFLDLLLRTLAWLAIYAYLNALFSKSSETKYPLVLRIWWGFSFSISCYSLVIENLYYVNHNIFPIRLLVSNVISTVLGLFLCNVGFSGKNEAEDGVFREPLLTGRELNKSNGRERVTPYSNASVFSILTFSWMSPLISLGYTKRLDLEDVPQLTSVDSVKEAFEVLKSKLECDGGGRKVTTVMLVKALILTAWKEIVLTAFLALIYSFVSYVGPYLIDSFVQYLNGHRESRNEGYLLVFAFLFAKLVECFTQRHWFFKLRQVGIRTKAALIAMIYSKSLTLSSQSKHVYTSGQIINLMTIDTARIGLFSWYMHDPWLVLVQVALALLIIYKNLGLSCVASFLAIVILMLANVPLWTLQEKYHGKLMESKDRRMKAMSEILRNMKILKLQGWEMKFLSRIFHLRNTEMRWLKRNVYTSAISTFFFWGSPTFLSVVTFGACMLMGIPFESGNIFSVLATFRILQEPIRNLPETISMIAQAKVSLDRISSFLCLDDLQSNLIEKIPRGSCDTAIEIVNGNFALDVSSANPIVKDINLRVTPGMRIAVCGTVGSGKSSLVSCIIGELPKMSGTIKLSGTKAYVAQSPWIQSGKIEENILFGKEMEREWYEKVLDACSLKKDLEILPSGDQTIIGEQGINLSGGQKQRIQIARAIYQDADIYIFDDPFSAVDAHTGTHLFKECLLGLLNSKTVLYITHQVEFLPAADLILVMKDGKIAQAGKYLDILTSGTNFMELVGAHKKALSTLDSIEAGSVSDNLNISKNNEVASVKKVVEKQNTKDYQIGKMDNVNEKKEQLVQEEKRGNGRVGFSVYWKYITTAYGGALVPFILLAQVLFQLLQIGSNYWMAWASPLGKSVALPVTGSTLISVFVALAIGSSFCILVRALLLVTAGYKTTTLLFNEMHLRIFRAPMSFFDATPSGRILNRASTDQSAVDSNIPHQVGAFAFSIMQLLGVIAVMSQVAWQVFFIFIPVTAIGIWLQQYYIRSAQELARLIGVCKAPVIQHFSETISGSTTIRCFDQESKFRDKIIKLIDGYSRPSFYNAGAMEWLCFRLDILSAILFLFSLLLMISVPEKTIDPSIAGLAITYGLNLNVVQFRIIWNLCNLENKIISLERILQYNCIPDEAPLVIESNKPACLWPSQGEVDIHNLQVRYAPHTPIVLQGITCTFKGGMKIGIVGRTGSGKSTLIQALFRIVEPTAGHIIIDGINISLIGLHDLRSRLSIIPQDPTMFEGTVRSNLDPLEEYTDEEIWEALDKCQLGDDVRKKEGGLESTVLENGENWSMGQRQLVCLGRVLLKKSKILVLDEATASVDTTTDTLIQQTLRKHCSGSTVITIAHRITSVLDSNMVLLLNRGLIEEYDLPAKLLKNKSSAFAKLVEEYKCTMWRPEFELKFETCNKSEAAENTLLLEPLISANCSSLSVGEKSKKANGGETVTPYASSNVFSILTFSWIGPLVALGYKKPLDLEDVPQLASIDSVKGAFPILRSKLEFEPGNSSGVTTLRLVKALIFTTWREILLTAFLTMTKTLASYVGPYLIDTFVQYLYGRRDFKNEGYLLVSTFVIAKLVECLAQRHWFFKLQQIGTRAKAALIALIYHKGLTLSCQSKQGHTSGEIINFMTVDAERIGDFSWYLHDPWMVILQVALALAILYKNLGVASIATLVATVIVMLANVPLGKLQENFQTKLMKSKDQRLKATSEILRNMRILKLQGWEMKFLSKLVELRNIEAGWLKKYVYTNAMTTFVFWGTPTFVAVVTFGTCLLLGIPLESGKILSALATFRILQGPIYNLPDTISMMVQTKVSLDRISSFLRLDDLQTDVVERLARGSSDTAIEVVDGIFSWDVSSLNPTLKDINFRVSHGMRVAVCGMVGSGKSSLLSCILGEVPKISGFIKMSGRKAYVAQTPWIQSGKIEENILFGKEMDRERYEKVLEACSLKKDLEILSFGDQTIIGERGINLSGGQKQRIQIARALYQDVDIYLFDDPFSAVDAHTGSHLFKECLLGLLESKTVIYVTHQVEFLPVADLILVMKDGRITQAGKYSDILNSGSEFMELVGAHKRALSSLDSIEAESASKELNTGEDGGMGGGKVSEETRDIHNSKPQDDIVGPKGQLVQEEEREKGRVGFSVYWKYITTAYGGALVPFILLTQMLFQVLQIGSNYWMAWATPASESVAPPVKGSTLIIVYVTLAIGSSFCILGRAMSLATAGYKTATLLFNKMHLFIFRAPMSFFDATPSGRILNRASTDQSTVDLNMPYLVGAFAFSIIQLLGIIAVMSQVAWQVFIVFVPVVAMCIWLQQYYIPSARELARLIGVCKAPVIQHFAETISGSTTIRSLDQECRFWETSMKLIDGNSRPKFHTSGVVEWLCFRLDMLSSLTFAFSLVFLISVPKGTIDPSMAGLAVTYGLNLNMIQAWVIWNLCTLENKIISVERILQYTSIDSEPPLVIESNIPEDHWPTCGEVDIRNLQVRYAPQMPLVLRGLTCTFHGGKKTGIVGRTGSGKSTLIQTIFRIVEPSAGQILIDGINISIIGLHDLRSRLSIIPQDPTMFEGTVRSNLDPLEEYADEQIWEVLDKCQLGDEVRKKEGKLDSTVSENGDNWSVGQRQLVCLGRVLLKKSKVLILDEATASVDTGTDNMIQQTLRHHFADSTVITIAHRMTSVLDSDMVLVLDHGLVEEYDSPTKLLENKSSSFAKLVAEYSVRSNSSFDN